nr:MAG: hypothetical protein AmFV_00262 [Apis mellifera filamentous virus]
MCCDATRANDVGRICDRARKTKRLTRNRTPTWKLASPRPEPTQSHRATNGRESVRPTGLEIDRRFGGTHARGARVVGERARELYPDRVSRVIRRTSSVSSRVSSIEMGEAFQALEFPW